MSLNCIGCGGPADPTGRTHLAVGFMHLNLCENCAQAAMRVMGWVQRARAGIARLDARLAERRRLDKTGT